ncbi:MAG: hypothetical protein M0020_08825 [Actinomycetota bacterium]|nr:hypothetical protein [Actinomycetota bacterium]
MKLFDTLLGRTKPAKANLDSLFALPSVAINLSVAGFTPSGEAGVCVKPASSASFDEAENQIRALLTDDAPAGSQEAPAAPPSLRTQSDNYGYQWLVIEDADLSDLVTKIHMVNTTLAEAGWETQLLCSVFGLSSNDGTAYLVYLYKRGTFYPFAPRGTERRDNALELRVQGLVEGDLPVESDLTRWFPLWGLPIR